MRITKSFHGYDITEIEVNINLFVKEMNLNIVSMQMTTMGDTVFVMIVVEPV